MPNYCECDLSIQGTEGDVVAFLEAMKYEDNLFSFNAVIPYPQRFASLDRAARDFDKAAGCEYSIGRPRDGFNSGGYEWCKENWGTKWDAGDVSIYKRGNTQMVSFRTAWNPPLPVMEAMVKKFPTLELELNYFECGMEYCGTWYFRPKDEYDDEVVRQSRGEYAGSRGG